MRKIWRTVGLAVLMLPGCGGDDRAVAGSDLAAANDDLAATNDDLAATNDDLAVTTNDMNSGCPASWLTPPTVDPSIAVPADGSSLLLHTAAVGTQNYACAGANVDGGATGAPFAWALVAPAAQLDDCAGVKVGSHSAWIDNAAFPQWASDDGSVIVAHRKATFVVGGDAIPWLILRAMSHSGTGIMSRVAYVQRVNTVGGVASGPCDAAHEGATLNVPYTADYYFFGN